MKNYDEVTTGLLERRDRYVADQKRKRKAMMETFTALCCVCLIVLLGFGIPGLFRQPDAQTPPVLNNTGNSDSVENSSGVTDHSENNIPSHINSDTPTGKNYPNLSALTLEQWFGVSDVVWKEGYSAKGNVPTGLTVELGDILITEELKAEFEKHPDDTIYAILVDFTPMQKQDITFGGKKLSEWIAEKDDLTAQGNDAEAKAIVQIINQAKEEYYFEQLDIFKDKFASMGLGIYHEERGCTIDNCIFYTFAARSQIEEFECDSDEAFIFATAIRFK